MDYKQVMLILGFLGFCLGVFNTWQSLRRDRVRLKVVSSESENASFKLRICVGIANTGLVPTTVVRVRASIDRWDSADEHWVECGFAYLDNSGHVSLPTVIQPGHFITIKSSSISDEVVEIKTTEVETACGKIFTANYKTW